MYDKIHCFKENCPYRNIFRSNKNLESLSVGGYIDFFLLIFKYIIRTEKINSEACHSGIYFIKKLMHV